jgi:hypothetical protein
MQNTQKDPKQDMMVPIGPRLMVFAGILLGLLLLVIGDSRNISGVTYAGKFILPAALIWGGLYLKEESAGIRITLLAVGGVMIIAGLLGMGSIASVSGAL